MRGCDAGIDGNFGRALLQIFVRYLVEFRAGDGRGTRPDAEFLGDGRGGMRMVTGDHHHSDTRGETCRDGGFGLWPGRVIHSRQTDEDEVLLNSVCRESARGIVQMARGRTQDAERLLGHQRDLRQNALPVRFSKRLDPGAGVEMGATLQQRVGRAVDKRSKLAVWQAADDGAPLAVGIEGNLLLLGKFALDSLAVATGL